MRLNYVQDSHRSRAVPLISVKTGQFHAALLSPHASEWRRLNLHWDKSAQRRIPCFGDSCKCQKEYWPAELRIYVPALVCPVRREGAEWLMQSGAEAKRGIIGITQAMVEILEERNLRRWNVLYRKGLKANSPMTFAPMPEYKVVLNPAFPSGLEVEQTLEAVFGAQTRVGAELGSVESPYKGPHGV